jgi:acyl dehydratase
LLRVYDQDLDARVAHHERELGLGEAEVEVSEDAAEGRHGEQELDVRERVGAQEADPGTRLAPEPVQSPTQRPDPAGQLLVGEPALAVHDRHHRPEQPLRSLQGPAQIAAPDAWHDHLSGPIKTNDNVRNPDTKAILDPLPRSARWQSLRDRQRIICTLRRPNPNSRREIMSTSSQAGMTTDMAELAGHAGEHLGYTEWTEMTQGQVNQFADVTDDHQYIHVDVERAKASPFGGTIAHGFLTLSLVAPISQQLLTVTDAVAGLNYGLDRVRFPAPLPVGAQWRGGAELLEVTEVKGGLQAKLRVTVEVNGSEKPALVAECLVRLYG